MTFYAVQKYIQIQYIQSTYSYTNIKVSLYSCICPVIFTSSIKPSKIFSYIKNTCAKECDCGWLPDKMWCVVCLRLKRRRQSTLVMKMNFLHAIWRDIKQKYKGKNKSGQMLMQNVNAGCAIFYVVR